MIQQSGSRSIHRLRSDHFEPNPTVRRTGASRFAQRQIEPQRRLAPVADLTAGCETVFPLDHWISDSRWLVRIARWLSVKGGIVILHDGETHGQTTAAVLDALLPQLRAAGYEFGRLEEAPNPQGAERPWPTTTEAHR